MFYTFFSKQTLLFGFTELADLDNEKQQITGCSQTKIRPWEVAVFVLQHCRIKNILTNSIFLSYFELKKEIFLPISGFSRTVATLKNVMSLALSKITSKILKIAKHWVGEWLLNNVVFVKHSLHKMDSIQLIKPMLLSEEF